MVVGRGAGAGLWRDGRGAGLAEYILVVGLVALVAMVGFRTFGSSVSAKADAQADCITDFEVCVGNPQGADGTHGGKPMVGDKNPKFIDVDAAKDAVSTKAEGTPFIDGGDGRPVHPSDLSQGQLGDCYFVATLAALAHSKPGAIEQGIKDNGDGTFTVTFYDRGILGTDTVKIKVTPEFPYKDGRWVFIKPGDTDGTKSELWPMLYEKAYAQWKGGYKAIGGGGSPDDVMSAITGQSSSWNRTSGLVWDMSFSDFADKFAGNVTVAATQGKDGAKGKAVFEDGRLVANHAYWVESVDRDKQTVTVRNPWGWGEKPVTLSWDDFKQGFGTVYTTKK
ncbi:MAG: C2 family cysteine protease [Polyangiaceae bacterium]